jgi:hypothetical protein
MDLGIDSFCYYLWCSSSYEYKDFFKFRFFHKRSIYLLNLPFKENNVLTIFLILYGIFLIQTLSLCTIQTYTHPCTPLKRGLRKIPGKPEYRAALQFCYGMT